jgi:hypothetical protein
VIRAATQNVFSLAATNFMLAMKGTADVVARVSFDSRHFEPSQLAPIADANLRVVFALAYAPDLLDIALAAHDAGMTNRGWAWVAFDTLSTAMACITTGARDGCGSLKGTQPSPLGSALIGWLFFEPLAQSSPQFFERVRTASIRDFALPSGAPLLVSTYAANLYDAIKLYANAIALILREGQSVTNGSAVVGAMRRLKPFVGETSSTVQLTAGGDLLQAYALRNVGCALDGAALTTAVVGVYNQSEQRLVLKAGVRWCFPGNTTTIPTDNSAQSVPIAKMTLQIPFSQYTVRTRETLICNFVVGAMMEFMQARCVPAFDFSSSLLSDAGKFCFMTRKP